MNNMEFSKRRLLINAVTRGLEKVLRVEEQSSNHPNEVEVISLPPRPTEIDEAESEQRRKIVREIRRLLFVIPRGLRTRLLTCPGVSRIRELVEGIDIRTLPEDIFNALTEMGFQ